MEGGRPKTRLGVTRFVPRSVAEPEMMCYITEGSKEEVDYLKGVKTVLTERGLLKDRKVICVNTQLDERILRCSHPLSRFQFLLDYVNLNYPNRPSDMKLWLVCDRDCASLSETQYDNLISEAGNNGVSLVVSNPAFQIWLFFHFYSWLREGIYEDGLTCKEQIRMLEKMIRRRLKGYNHGTLDFTRFVSRIPAAVTNSTYYETDVRKLKDDFGTNFKDILLAMGWNP